MGRQDAECQVNLFFDECVSPAAAVHFRRETTHAACHPRDVKLTGARDPEVLEYCIRFDHTLITINGRDFRKLCGAADIIHPGLIIIPSWARDRQIKAISRALALIEAEAPPESPQDWIINRVVEVLPTWEVIHARLPRD